LNKSIRNAYWERYYRYDHETLAELVRDAVITFLMDAATLENKKIKEN